MSGKQVGYVRVSSILQNTARQLDGLTLDRTFEDSISGKDMNRPQLDECLKFLREGDTLHVHSMDRLARNLGDLKQLVEGLTKRGVQVHFHKENLLFNGDASPMANLMLNMLGSVAEFERALILDRQREGIAIAKGEGKYLGRRSTLTDDQVQDMRRRAAAGDKKVAIARDFGISRETLYQKLRDAVAVSA
ncbi:recombinase family protein [Propionivibrio sp.]|uniref:recombinase family protein n=1 Tax=Propionivibrio sp. TaxID=2212460 RepID=UPI003BF068F0